MTSPRSSIVGPGAETNLQRPLSKIEEAKLCRQMAELYWRHADTTTDPDRWRMAASEYHTRALKLEAGA